MYLTKGKSMKAISFNDLTLEENLTYVKHNIKDVTEAFHLFEITKAKFEGRGPDLPASLIQKIATKTKDLKKSLGSIVNRNEYKAMLKII
jgi:hypothetical protein